MSRIPKVHHHVLYVRDIDEVGPPAEPFPEYVTDYVKLRPATITVVNVDDTVDLRVGHHNETYSDVPLRTSPEETNVYIPH